MNDISLEDEESGEQRQQPIRYYATPSEMRNRGFRHTDLSRVVDDGHRLVMWLGVGEKIEAWRAV